MSPPDDAAFQQAKQAFLDGLAALQAERFDDAERLFLASLKSLPGRISTLVNLAATRVQLLKTEEALATANEVLAIEPDNADAWLHRGTALGLMGRHGEALDAFDALLKLAPQLPTLWLRRGETLERLNRNADALAAYERALAMDPKLAAAWSRLGGLLRDLNRLDDAAHAYRQAIAHGADDTLHRYYLASVSGDTLAAPPRGYVERLFDDYAGDFDQHLIKVLRYQAPEVLTRRLDTLHPSLFRSALDLGCGTGLCGPWLRARSKSLTGVDLSRQMLHKASALNVYDQLLHADITEHLQTTADTHDLVIAADVFIYVGDLSPVFAALTRVLSPGGVFCFSVERPEGPAESGQEHEGFVLRPSLRYAHSQAYVTGLAQQHGYELLALHDGTVRHDQNQAISGLFVWLQRR
jgi:predicted TPR repeat methyltransferase